MIEHEFVTFKGVRLTLAYDPIFKGDIILTGEDENTGPRVIARFNYHTGGVDIRPHNGIVPIGELE